MQTVERFIDTGDFRNVMGRLVKALRAYTWCLIGGRAVEVWSNPPQTPDVDILIDLRSRRSVRAVERRMFRVGFEIDRRFFGPGMTPMWFFTDSATKTEVDIIGAFENPHFWAIERAAAYRIKHGATIKVAQAEDVVILKANAACSPGREDKFPHDIAAIKAVAKANALDADYIETVLTEAGADWSDERRLLRKLGILE